MAWLGRLQVFCLRARAAQEVDKFIQVLLPVNLMRCDPSCLLSCSAVDRFLREIIHQLAARTQRVPVNTDLEDRVVQPVDIHHLLRNKKRVTDKEYGWQIRLLLIRMIQICTLAQLSKKKISDEWMRFRVTTAGRLCRTNPTTIRNSLTTSLARSNGTMATPNKPVLQLPLPSKTKQKRIGTGNGPTIFKLKAGPFRLLPLP